MASTASIIILDRRGRHGTFFRTFSTLTIHTYVRIPTHSLTQNKWEVPLSIAWQSLVSLCQPTTFLPDDL